MSLGSQWPVLRVYAGCLTGTAPPVEWEVAADGAPSDEVPPQIPLRWGGTGARQWYKASLTHRLFHERLTVAEAVALAETRRWADAPTLGLVVEGFVGSFGQRGLARFLLQVCEDARVDAAVVRDLPGMTESMLAMRRWELQRRPPLQTMTAREGTLELITRASISCGAWHDEPASALDDSIRRAVSGVCQAGSTLEDVLRLATGLYEVVSSLGAYGGLSDELAPRVDAAVAGSVFAWGSHAADVSHLEGADALAVRTQNATFRDRLILRAQSYEQDYSGNRASVFDLSGVEEHPLGEHAPAGGTATTPIDDGEAEGAADTEDLLSRYESPWQPMPHHHEVGSDDWWREDPEGPLTASPATGFWVYPEWDHANGLMRQRWCGIREHTAEAVRPSRLYDRLVAAQAPSRTGLVSVVRRAPRERLVHKGGLGDGNDIDVDAIIRYVSDVRSSGSGDDKVYASHLPEERDVAVALVLDTSASTADHVRQGDEDTGQVARLHAVWGRDYRRTLDVEIESAALLMEVASGTSDALGVFSFSSDGRARNQFGVVKDFTEPLRRSVKSRLVSLRPHGTTRLGVAIRHATRRLLQSGARTPILLLLSDGLPRDRGYGDGTDGSAPFHAYQDVAAAVRDAQRSSVRTVLLLTAEPGIESLIAMCPKDVIWPLAEADDLPTAILSAYVRRSVA